MLTCMGEETPSSVESVAVGDGEGTVWYRMITWVLLLGMMKFVMLSFRIGSPPGIW